MRDALGLSLRDLAEQSAMSAEDLQLIEDGTHDMTPSQWRDVVAAMGASRWSLLSDPPPGVVLRRSGRSYRLHQSDAILDELAALLGYLLQSKVLLVPKAAPQFKVKTTDDIERAARHARQSANVSSTEPIRDLQGFVSSLGMLAFLRPLPKEPEEGSYVRLADVGLAWINSAPQFEAWRQRFTLAHELAHHVMGHSAHQDTDEINEEKQANWFAAHLLLPVVGLQKRFEELASRPTRDRLVTIAAEYQVSWTSFGHQAIRAGIATKAELASSPSADELRETGIAPPYLNAVSPPFQESIELAYKRGLLSRATAEALAGRDMTDEPRRLPHDKYLRELRAHRPPDAGL